MYKKYKIEQPDILSKSATKIQSVFKGFLTRKAYQIEHIPKSNLYHYNVLIEGNDPEIKGLPQHNANERIALIGTSGMRSIELACQLSEGVAKVIILDNSLQVTNFWRAARSIMQKTKDKTDFLNQLAQYVKTSGCNRSILFQQEFEYLEKLFKTHGFEKIHEIVNNTTIIGQSWANESILVKLKNILIHNGINTIYAYPSNIVAYLNDCKGSSCNCQKNTQTVLKNINDLNPVLAIHTDLVQDKPKNFFLIEDHSPSKVTEQLGLNSVNAPHVRNELIVVQTILNFKNLSLFFNNIPIKNDIEPTDELIAATIMANLKNPSVFFNNTPIDNCTEPTDENQESLKSMSP